MQGNQGQEQNDQNKRYGLFNGRRTADQYVKGWLKGVALISGTGLAIMLGFNGWVATKIYDHETRLTSMETSKFTNTDAASLLLSVKEELQSIRIEIAKLPKRNEPPQWLKDVVSQHTNDIRMIREQITDPRRSR